MSDSHSFFAMNLVNPLLLAGVLVVLSFITDHYLRGRNALLAFVIRLLSFIVLTALMFAGGVVPYQPGLVTATGLERLIVAVLKVLWWLGAAWLTAGFLRAFVVLGRQPRETRLVQDLLAALCYVGAFLAVVANVFDMPVRGLLVTSGALAIIIGLALQNSLGDVFSGIILNLERPYRVGDWITVDDTVRGKVIDTDWRATHILTSEGTTAIVPNSVIARSKLVNSSLPTPIHWATVHIRLQPSLTTPAAGCHLLKQVMLGSTHILRTPEPTVIIRDISEEAIDFELSYPVTDVGAISAAQNELFDRVYRAVGATGARFSPRLSLAPAGAAQQSEAVFQAPERLFAGIALFWGLTPAEGTALRSQMQRTEFKPSEVIIKSGTILDELYLLSEGVVAVTVEAAGSTREVMRLTPGEYFGESSMLTGVPLKREITALTRVVVYKISKAALAPLLKARPAIADQLSQTLAARQLAYRTVPESSDEEELPRENLADRIAAEIRRLFLGSL